MKRIIGTYIDNIEVNKVGDKIELLNIEYRKSFLTDLVNYLNSLSFIYTNLPVFFLIIPSAYPIHTTPIFSLLLAI